MTSRRRANESDEEDPSPARRRARCVLDADEDAIQAVPARVITQVMDLITDPKELAVATLSSMDTAPSDVPFQIQDSDKFIEMTVADNIVLKGWNPLDHPPGAIPSHITSLRVNLAYDYVRLLQPFLSILPTVRKLILTIFWKNHNLFRGM
jgi:hypothetical protein